MFFCCDQTTRPNLWILRYWAAFGSVDTDLWGSPNITDT